MSKKSNFTKRLVSIESDIDNTKNYLKALEMLNKDVPGILSVGETYPGNISFFHENLHELKPKFFIQKDYDCCILSFYKEYTYSPGNKKYTFRIFHPDFEEGIFIYTQDGYQYCCRIINLESKLKDFFPKEFIKEAINFAHPTIAKLILKKDVKIHKSSFLTPRLKLVLNFM